MSRARAQPGRVRAIHESSPPLDDFYTGVSDINPDEALHSTMQDRELAPHWKNRHRYSDDERSESMSIEFGRGIKRAGDELDDISSNAVFTFGDDNSRYEIASTPPFKDQASRKSSANIRKDTLIRKANEGAKRTVSQTARVPSAGRKPDLADELRSASYAKNTRFQPKKINSQKPNATQAGDTATSWDIPNVSNVGDLIDPQQNDSASFKHPSRFTPKALYRMPVTFEGTERLPVSSVPIPEDEKKIYAALQTLQDKLTRLEHAHELVKTQLEQCEDENNELRLALAREEQLRRPDSALGSEDESAKEKWRLERTKLHSSNLALKQRLDRSEQRSKQHEHELKASIRERDSLVTQLGVECYRVEELEAENAALRRDHETLRAEVQTLRAEVQQMRGPAKRSLAEDLQNHSSTRQASSSRKLETPADHTHTKWLDIDMNLLDMQARKNIASSVRQQLEQQRTRRSTTQSQLPRPSMFDLEMKPSRQSKPAPARASRPMFQDDQTNDDIYTEFELTRNTQTFTRRSAPTQNGDITDLTPNDPLQVQALRQLLEQERRAGHLRRQSSAPAVTEAAATPVVSANIQRRSSLRDPAAAPSEQVRARNVRVQSPPADAEANTQQATVSLPVRSAARPQAPTEEEEGHTSAFIIPDITMHNRSSPSEPLDDAQLKKHDVPNCTVCNAAGIDGMNVPALLRISSRTDLPEDATQRPAQAPQDALAIVVKQLNDELEHLKLALTKYQKQHQVNEPALGSRDRKQLYEKIDGLMAECKKKEDQIYALYDALEGQNMAQPTSQDDKTTQSLHLGGFDGAHDDYSDEESIGLPNWEGLSEDEEAAL